MTPDATNPIPAPVSSAAATPWPRQIRYIIGNEACERFSFYGMRNVLTVFLVDWLLRALPVAERAPRAKEIFHLFVMAVYFFPLLGGWLADRYWGKYRTILWLSLVYCAGHGCLALFEDSPTGFYTGLFLIALGSGGIKPCVSAFVGDQFTQATRSRLPAVFGAFYWAINLGSLFASLLIPKLLRAYGPPVAFGLPGLFMLIATVVFWAGRRHYHREPPTGRNPHGFLRIVTSALRARPGRGTGGDWLSRAQVAHPEHAIEGARAVFQVLKVFAFIPFFWMLFDQKASAWVLQARRMDLQVGPYTFEPSQLQFVNPALVMLFIPLMTGFVYPALARAGFPLTPLRRMTIGLFVAGTSFVMTALIEAMLDGGTRLSVLWQLGPYVALTLSEILVSVTGLEFAYAQAPPAMKGVIMSLWTLTVSAANLVVVVVTRLDVFDGAASFLFYAALVGAAGVGLALVARNHVSREFLRQS